MAWLKNLIFSNYLGGFIRTALATLGGILVANGLISQEESATFMQTLGNVLINSIPVLLAYFGSIMNKKEMGK